jgi:hypothetical protein
MFQRFKLELFPKLKINALLAKHTILLGIRVTISCHTLIIIIIIIITFTDGGFISPSVPMENIYLPMVNWLTIGTSEHSIFTDDIFIFPSVRMDTDGRNNFTKLTVSMLATVLDNPRTFYSLIMCIYNPLQNKTCHQYFLRLFPLLPAQCCYLRLNFKRKA